MSRARKINPPHRLRVVASPDDIRRFLAMVVTEAVPTDVKLGPCWLWTGHKDGKGYGQFHFDGRTVWAYRFAYALIRGTIPGGRQIDHRCNNPSCVNPYHGTHRAPRANYARANRGRAAKPKLEPAPF